MPYPNDEIEQKMKSVISFFDECSSEHRVCSGQETDPDISEGHAGHAAVYSAMTDLLRTFEEYAFGGFGGSDAIDIRLCRKQMETLSSALSNY